MNLQLDSETCEVRMAMRRVLLSVCKTHRNRMSLAITRSSLPARYLEALGSPGRFILGRI